MISEVRETRKKARSEYFLCELTTSSFACSSLLALESVSFSDFLPKKFETLSNRPEAVTFFSNSKNAMASLTCTVPESDNSIVDFILLDSGAFLSIMSDSPLTDARSMVSELLL